MPSNFARRNLGLFTIATTLPFLILACGDDGAPASGGGSSSIPDSGSPSQSATATQTPAASGSAPGVTDASMPPEAGNMPVPPDAASSADGGAADGAAGTAFDPQVPPTEVSQVGAWLDRGFYNDWVCEEMATEKTGGAAAIHVHGASSRVCANVLLAASPAPGNTDKQFRSGVAAVKEVYDDTDTLVGRFVEYKAEADSAGGNGWFWYTDAGEETGGFGVTGCTGCHGAAGADADHPGAGDYVYWQETDPEQLPPVGDVEALTTWLEAGAYLDWECEAEPTEKTDGVPGIHAHGSLNRICSNNKLAGASDGLWQAGVASVKELFSADGGKLGYAVALKVNTDSAAGDGWYWYDTAGPEGFGQPACTGCHSAAASDADHPGAGDYVYFRVMQ